MRLSILSFIIGLEGRISSRFRLKSQICMQMFTPFNSIAVFFHELRNIPCYLNVVVNIELILFHHGHKKKRF